MTRLSALALAMLAIAMATPSMARDSLGIFSDWGAFRDPGVPRCYAIAKARPDRRAKDFDPFVSVGTWPGRQVRNQVHFRLSRKTGSNAAIRLRLGSRTFELTGNGGNAWAQDQSMDAAIVAAMRSAERMTVSARDTRGRSFTNSYDLAGAATAMDAATVGCSRMR